MENIIYYHKDIYTVYHSITYNNKTMFVKNTDCIIHAVSIVSELSGFPIMIGDNTNITLNAFYIKLNPSGIVVPIVYNGTNHKDVFVNHLQNAINDNKNIFTFSCNGEISGEPYIYNFVIHKKETNEYVERFYYRIKRTIDVLGYKKELLYESYEVHSADILKNSFSLIELPDELGFKLKDFPHFQRVLTLYPNCLNIPVLGDDIEVYELVDELNAFLNQTETSKFIKSYDVKHNELNIKFTLEFERRGHH